ncbi:katanin p80 WD40 repeat-containing subunit B1 isoform X2 [Ischnura elegans]|uniref:katanin p80 WD40 repeat-containing subunit B1 isoform X2 n=1 Tax=Ischnura elegans TaxID=197161 RepID=UPI001ED87E73|nr:katanin p80 WD40 repeat-containing subunit B1 isoform X2 [Ischnura elegans]
MASVTKRSWKLHFVAHGSKVRCLALGHKSGRVLVTGGDDKLVNLWAVGKPNCIMSLSGNASPVECVQFGNTEELVVSGAGNGALRIWDLEAAKMVRTLQGHKLGVRCTHFHPYGDFLTSGSVDKEVKLWDIRRKGCIYTYKGHKLTVNSVKFSPDGQWIASGSDDGAVKLWDLRAGRLLTEFVDQGGGGNPGSRPTWGGIGGSRPVTCVEFHPHEFLLASGTTHRVVRFWDLENLSLVSTSEQDPAHLAPVRCLSFSDEGLCLYCGSEDSLRVLGWEPAVTYHSLPIGWSQVWDIAIAQNQLIGASFHSTNVVLYVVDLKGIQPNESPSMLANTIQASDNGNTISPEKLTSLSGGTSLVSNAPDVIQSTPTQTATSSTSPFSHGQSVRKSFNKERPPPGSKHRLLVKTIEESDKSGTDPEDEMQSVADIKDVGDYRAIFQPNRALARTPPLDPTPFPAPLEEDPSLPQILQPPREESPYHSLEYSPPVQEPSKDQPPSFRENRLPSPRKDPSMRRNSTKDQPSPYNFQESDFPVKLSNIKHSPSEPALNKANAFHSRSNSLSRTFVGVQTSSSTNRVPSVLETSKTVPLSSGGKAASQSLPPYVGPSQNRLNHGAGESQSANVGPSVRGMQQQRYSPPKEGVTRPPTAPSSPRVTEDPPLIQYLGQPSVTHSQNPVNLRPQRTSTVEPPSSHNFISPSLDSISHGIRSMKVDDEDLIVPMSSDKPSGLDMDEFLPKSYKQGRFGMGLGGHGIGSPYPELSETEVFSSLMRGFEPMMTVLGARQRALQIIFSIWNSKDMKTAIESAVEMKDISVLVDILGVLTLKPSVWSLDLCVSLLPSIHELLQSKYEMYMRVGVDCLRLILRNFTSVIRTHVTGPAPHGVDIPREERYRKCMACYEHLVSIRSFLLKRQTLQGKLGQSFRELHVQMQNLDNSA